MSTKINIVYKDKEYILEYSRASIKQMEQTGFVLDKIAEQPMTMIPMLVYGAFAMHHKGIKRNLTDEIFDHITNKFGDGGDGFVQALLEMYAETLNTLTGNPVSDAGNTAVWKVIKG